MLPRGNGAHEIAADADSRQPPTVQMNDGDIRGSYSDDGMRAIDVKPRATAFGLVKFRVKIAARSNTSDKQRDQHQHRDMITSHRTSSPEAPPIIAGPKSTTPFGQPPVDYATDRRRAGRIVLPSA